MPPGHRSIPAIALPPMRPEGWFAKTEVLGHMRALSIVVTLAFIAAGCSRHDADRFALDGLLSSNRIDRIEIVAEVPDRGDLKTNVLTGERITALLRRLNTTNRIADPVRHKSYISGYIFFYDHDARLGLLQYFPAEQVLSYQDYEFSLRDTNEIRWIFQ